MILILSSMTGIKIVLRKGLKPSLISEHSKEDLVSGLQVFCCVDLGNWSGSSMLRGYMDLDQKGQRTTCGRAELVNKAWAGRRDRKTSKSWN